jgi:hypothetical protein
MNLRDVAEGLAFRFAFIPLTTFIKDDVWTTRGHGVQIACECRYARRGENVWSMEEQRALYPCVLVSKCSRHPNAMHSPRFAGNQHVEPDHFMDAMNRIEEE